MSALTDAGAFVDMADAVIDCGCSDWVVSDEEEEGQTTETLWCLFPGPKVMAFAKINVAKHEQ